MNKKKKKTFTNARKVIEKFGGIRPMASKMDVPATTVQGWKKRNSIPLSREEAVKKTAEEYDIDLSPYIKGGDTAPEGKKTSNPNKIEASGSSSKNSSPFQKEARNQAAAGEEKTSVSRTEITDPTIRHETIMGKISEAERRAVQRSSLITAFLILLVVGAGAVLLWPTQEQTTKNTARLAALEGDVRTLKEEQTFLQKIIPDKFQEDFGKLQEEAQILQERFSTLTQKAETLNREVLGPDAGTLTQRLERLEVLVEDLSGSEDLTALINRVQKLQQSVQGQEQLSRTVSELNRVIRDMQGQVETIDQELAEARENSPALGETFEGVSAADLKAATMLVGLAQFRSSLNRNTPFAEDLELMKKMVAEDNPELLAAIERLAPKAEEGVLSPQGLSQELRGLTGEIVVSSLKGEDITLKEQAQARLSKVLQVEQDGVPVTGTETQKKIARAQQALDEGNIQAALIELQSLEGQAGEKAQPLVQEAEKTLLAQQVEQMLTQSVLSRLSRQGTVPWEGNVKNILNELQNMGRSGRLVQDEESGMQIYIP